MFSRLRKPISILLVALAVVSAVLVLVTVPRVFASTYFQGHVGWSVNNDGCFTSFKPSQGYTVARGHYFHRDIECGDSSGYWIQVGFLTNDSSTCGNTNDNMYWADKRPSSGGVHWHCYGIPFGTSPADTWYISAFEISTGSYSISIVDTTTGTTVCNGGTGCISANQNADFDNMKIQEEVWNWTEGNDFTNTIVWVGVGYFDVNESAQYLTSSGSSVQGPNPPWIGLTQGNNNQWYSCSKFGRFNPC